MRSILFLMLAFSLTGCSLLNKSTHPAPKQPVHTATEHSPKAKPVYRPVHAVLYKNAEELVGKPFRDMGEVSGSSCQVSARDTPPNIASAQKRMQSRAAAMKANAVLLHDCQIVSSIAGCYRQAICQGTALKVSE
ncbi:Rcs stress response system protein RcsF [Pectobacteriaceae bacterium CE70]|uniref:Outer membrane lipoprotein RcsF n=1 Tax=Serratia sp. (strain ATCC 39006) TaxID=104623 RepID=A0A2I5T539_SERS3|nr:MULTISPECIES: Rcs stress response system protein RcsF [Enterobacterales]WJV57435.1 Rcs stress response system protein RcsF [Pectobacteriaceae bacterium C111]WJV61771.1 Rcs stress response system protein RcsF [Pectobacteriaceae bacterium C52]WJV66035.1 Rcs stress response system protein RcsF [Pectobacteriaceae bacterium CE70]WJY10052.1 Rcs stress response system protein RcsF [Pectobacteriaceae bacterium C80]AUG99663.1 Rcs stress response system protein RcsF [Serratia sp. ATCC 39006]